MPRKIKLDSLGIGAMLRSSGVKAEISLLGAEVSAHATGARASGRPVPVQVRSRTASGGGLSPRPAVDISLADAAGLAVEAKHGTLVKAAAATGLEVKARRAVK